MASNAAKRYAQAMASLAKEKGTLDAWQADLAALTELLSNEDADNFFANPNVTDAQKRQVIESVLASGQPDARNLALLLLERGKIGLIPEVHQLFTDARLAERGIAVAEVTTAEPMDNQEQEFVRDRLRRLIGKEIELRTRTDPSIIGGIVARVGDQLIDGSVVAQLRRLRARLAAG